MNTNAFHWHFTHYFENVARYLFKYNCGKAWLKTDFNFKKSLFSDSPNRKE